MSSSIRVRPTCEPHPRGSAHETLKRRAGSRGKGVSRYLSGILLAGLLGAGGCGGEANGGEEGEALALGGAVSSSTPASTDAGLRTLAAGGNAVDAAAAISMALTVTQPSRAGLGGTALLLVRTPEGSVHVVRGGPDTGAPDPDAAPASPEGLSAVDTIPASPDLLTVLEAALDRFGSGRVEWADLVEPALRLAEDGFLLEREEHRSRVRNLERLGQHPSSAELFLRPDGSAPTERSRVRVPSLATTLRRLARAGPGDFYDGDLSERIGEAGARSGRPDLLDVAPPVIEEPLTGEYRGWRVVVAPARPTGARILRSLRVLRQAPEEVLAAPGTARTLWMAEALTFGTLSPDGGGGSPVGEGGETPTGESGETPLRDGDVDTAARTWLSGRPALPTGLTIDTAVAAGAPGRPRARRTPERIGPAPIPVGQEGAATTFAVLDGAGGMVVGILSMGREYGTTRIAGDMGFLFAATGPPGGAGAATFVFRGDSLPAMAAGAPGTSAPDALVQVTTAWIDGGMPLEEAVSLPRLQVLGDSLARPHLFLEGLSWSRGILDEVRRWSAVPDSVRRVPADSPSPTGLPPAAEAGSIYWGADLRVRLTDRGYLLGEWPDASPDERLDPRFGRVQAVAADAGSSGWEGSADPRGDGAVRIVSPEEAAVTSRRR